LLWIGAICGLIAYANFSTGIMLFLTCVMLLLIGRVPVRFLAALALMGVLAGGIAFAIGQRGKTVMARIDRFVSSDDKDTPYQAEQSFIAIANGGLLGRFAGNSQQKDFLPHPYSDFIYAIIVEEWGLIGGSIVVFLYLALLWRGLMAVDKSTSPFGGLLSAGLSVSLVMQAMLNMCVAVGLVPVTGQPLPLVSMGGTSLIFTGLSFGIILSVSRGEIQNFSSQRRNHAAS
jgi:cell division protein FtsW